MSNDRTFEIYIGRKLRMQNQSELQATEGAKRNACILADDGRQQFQFASKGRDPEQYRRLREWEDEQKERRNKAIVGTATSGVKAAMVIAKLLKK